MSAALHADADVDVGEAVLAQEQDRLLQLVLQGRGLHQLQGAAVDLIKENCTIQNQQCNVVFITSKTQIGKEGNVHDLMNFST